MAATGQKKYHVGLGEGDVGAYVLVPGDPGRTPMIAKYLHDAHEVAFSREYRTFTGSLGGSPVSTVSTGMGGPSVAIAIEELSELGVHTFLRVGTCGAAQPEIKMGDLVIATGAVRSEGTPNGYVPLEYPAVASLEVVNALVESATAAGARHHVGLGPGEVGSYVLVPGDPGRTPMIAKHLEAAREIAFSREYRTFTGSVAGIPVSAMSTGMGGPSVAIAIEELSDLGVHTFLRVGTCGAAQPEIKMGDLVIATGSVRSEGTPNGYVPLEYPAIASLDVVNALVEAARAAGVPHHVGIIRSVDALYSDLVPERMPRPAQIREELQMWSRAGVLSNDMESSTLFVVARLRKLRAGTINLCVDELGAGEIHHLDPSFMDRMLSVAVDAIRRLIEKDAIAANRQ